VKDGLEATLAADSASLESLRNGVELTHEAAEHGILARRPHEINPGGEKFDPHPHQAMQHACRRQGAKTPVRINVLQKATSLHRPVIRPAAGTVAKPRDPQA